MDPLRLLLRMSRFARRPPSMRRVIVVFGAIAVAVAIWGIERAGLWPDALTTDRVRTPAIRLP